MKEWKKILDRINLMITNCPEIKTISLSPEQFEIMFIYFVRRGSDSDSVGRLIKYRDIKIVCIGERNE